MTTLLDQDRHATAKLAVRASSLALGLAASVGLQFSGAGIVMPHPDANCPASVNVKFTAL